MKVYINALVLTCYHFYTNCSLIGMCTCMVCTITHFKTRRWERKTFCNAQQIFHPKSSQQRILRFLSNMISCIIVILPSRERSFTQCHCAYATLLCKLFYFCRMDICNIFLIALLSCDLAQSRVFTLTVCQHSHRVPFQCLLYVFNCQSDKYTTELERELEKVGGGGVSQGTEWDHEVITGLVDWTLHTTFV